jgi:hypothetical protein
MNSRQKEVLEQSLKDEQVVLDALVDNYTKALADIKKNIRELQANPLTQSKAYQLEFQKQLEQQISGILDNLQGKNFSSIAGYLQTCYETGFVGTAYDWQGQGVPLVIPIDEGQVIKAVEKTGDDFKLSNKLGVSTKELKQQVKTELQRGLATQLSYAEIARNISDYGQSNMNRSMLIARTEGHRVQSEARMDAMKAAKKKGADIVKQWDATLDGNTRQHHRELDGQIRELDEPFEVAGMKVECPGDFGIAAEDCNCRCCVLQRARWAVEKVDPDTGELTEGKYQKWNNETGGFIETTGYQDFKDRYLKAAQTVKPKTPKTPKLNIADESGIISQARQTLNIAGVEYREIEALKERLSEGQIIDRLGGGDMTKGSCSSLAFAYSGNVSGFDVLDFRDGQSRSVFASNAAINEIATLPGVNGTVIKDFNDFTATHNLLQMVEKGKEYYLGTGQHAAIIRKTETGFEYLELQSAASNGFKPLTDDVLKRRFGCKRSHSSYGTKLKASNQLIECESLGQSSEFQRLLGYINTAEGSQRKGVKGSVK